MKERLYNLGVLYNRHIAGIWRGKQIIISNKLENTKAGTGRTVILSRVQRYNKQEATKDPEVQTSTWACSIAWPVRKH